MIRGMAERTAAKAVDQRVDDLLLRMTLAEKAGMFQTMIVVGSGSSERSSTFSAGVPST